MAFTHSSFSPVAFCPLYLCVFFFASISQLRHKKENNVNGILHSSWMERQSERAGEWTHQQQWSHVMASSKWARTIKTTIQKR